MSTTISNFKSPASASESATLPETPPAATECPVGLVWREADAQHWYAVGFGFGLYLEVPNPKAGTLVWRVQIRGIDPCPALVDQGTAPTLEAAKAAAEACLRAWVARLNASLGGA